MEIYILDDKYRRIQVVDRFESLIWTERYDSAGDFQLTVLPNSDMRTTFVEGTQIAVNVSDRIMVVENLENKTDSEGRSVINVTGRSLESAMEGRVVRRNMNGTNTEPKFVLASNPPATALRSLFTYICVNGNLNTADKIPGISTANNYLPNTIAEPEEPVVLEFEPKTLYAAIKETCEIYGLGFRLYRGLDNTTLYFNIYSGDDRTTGQTSRSAVIFSPDLDNLSNVSQLSSIEQHKNVALVVAKQGSMWVYPDEDSVNLSGFDRKVVVVDANDIEYPAGTTLNDALLRRGKDELSKYKKLQAVDCEVPKNSRYTYGVDYNLGDLIEIRTDDGVTNRMRITEQIFVDDSEGERAYPTLRVDEFITPGSWYAWDSNGVWDAATEVWAFAGYSISEENLLPNADVELGTTGGWSTYGGTTMVATNVTAERRSGTWGLKFTTTNTTGGVASRGAELGPSPIGSYTGRVYVKGDSGDTYTVYTQEVAGTTVVSETASTLRTANGSFQNVSVNHTKTQAATAIRVTVRPTNPSTMFLDDALVKYNP